MGAALLLGGCAAGGPDGVAAFGQDASGPLGIVMMCDRQRTVTEVSIGTERAPEDPLVVWVGRTVEPIAMFRINAEEPPSNWVLDVDGLMVDGQEYSFRATGADLHIEGPVFTRALIEELAPGQVLDAAGRAHPIEDFLDHGCDG